MCVCFLTSYSECACAVFHSNANEMIKTDISILGLYVIGIDSDGKAL